MAKFRTSKCKRCKQGFRLAYNSDRWSDPNCEACEFIIITSKRPGDQERALNQIKKELGL